MVRNPADLDRREFLKRTATASTTGLVAAGATGTATARSEPLPPARVESLLETHADGVLSALEADRIVDPSDLPTGQSIDFADVVAGRPGAAAVSVPGKPDELRVVTEVERGTLTLLVRPGSGEATALLDDGDRRLAYDSDRGWYDFEAASSCSCTGTPCPDYPAYLEECCVGGDCTYECQCL